jgi:hypothetical protein
VRNAVETALKKSHEFYGFDPRQVDDVQIDQWPDALVCLGGCAGVNYVSDKWDGKLAEYVHRFDSGTRLFLAVPKPRRGKNMLIILGNFKVTAGGIVG